MPLPADDMPVKETDAAVADFHGIRHPTALIPPVKEIIPEFLSGNPTRFPGEMPNQHPDGPALTFLCPFTFSVNPKCLCGLSVPFCAEYLCHNASPFFMLINGMYYGIKKAGK
jgi:hypothetical protein